MLRASFSTSTSSFAPILRRRSGAGPFVLEPVPEHRQAFRMIRQSLDSKFGIQASYRDVRRGATRAARIAFASS
jgi:hypothetical protein